MKASFEWRQKYYKNRMNFYKEYLGGKCKNCGTLENLEFDHVEWDKKLFTISTKYDAKWEIMKSELDKCQLLCKACHLDKSQNEGDTKARAIHGSLGMYRHYKCRCEKCKKTWNEYHRNRKRSKRSQLASGASLC